MENFLIRLLYIFFTAFGMITGGCFIGSISAGLIGQGPLRMMVELANDLKIWAAVAAIGGTFGSLQTLETGLLKGQLHTVVKELGFIFAAFAGSHLGYLLIRSLAESKR